MAAASKVNARLTKNSLPDIELISVQEDSIASQKRRTEVHQILARLHVLSHRRGRPSSKQEDVEIYAA